MRLNIFLLICCLAKVIQANENASLIGEFTIKCSVLDNAIFGSGSGSSPCSVIRGMTKCSNYEIMLPNNQPLRYTYCSDAIKPLMAWTSTAILGLALFYHG